MSYAAWFRPDLINLNVRNINLSSVNGYPYPWTSTLGNTVSTYTLAGLTANVPKLLGQITFPYTGDYFITLKCAYTRISGGVGNDTHGMLLTNGGGLPTFPGGDFGMAALPSANEIGSSTFTTLVSNIIVEPPLTKGFYYFDSSANNYIASLITDIPVIHYNPPKL